MDEVEIGERHRYIKKLGERHPDDPPEVHEMWTRYDQFSVRLHMSSRMTQEGYGIIHMFKCA